MNAGFVTEEGKKLRTVFMGTPDFSVPCLKVLCGISEVLAVVTQPDRPKGRGQKLKPSPVKVFAEAQGIPVYQPLKVKAEDFVTILEDLAPDLIVVVAFGQILSKRILDIPPYGCINVHASLLPRYRGAAPMQWAILNGETETGITTMFMDAGLDTGDMLLKRVVPIGADMTFGELHDLMMDSGADLLEQTIVALLKNRLPREKQEDALSNYAPMLTKDTGYMDWTRSAKELHDLVRGLSPAPGAFTRLGEEKMKIFCTRKNSVPEGLAGEIVKFTADGFVVRTGDGGLEVLELQVQGKKRMTAKEYLRGHKLLTGQRFQ